MMNKEVKQLWVVALRSGEYKQGEGSLKQGDYFCCLGVLCDIHSKQGDNEGWIKGKNKFYNYLEYPASLPPEVLKWSKLTNILGDTVLIKGKEEKLSSHNDEGRTFLEIADAIEAQL